MKITLPLKTILLKGLEAGTLAFNFYVTTKKIRGTEAFSIVDYNREIQIKNIDLAL